MKIAERAYNHNIKLTGTKKITQIATINGFRNFTVNQRGKMNEKYLSRER
jgi:hypothetical protein